MLASKAQLSVFDPQDPGSKAGLGGKSLKLSSDKAEAEGLKATGQTDGLVYLESSGSQRETLSPKTRWMAPKVVPWPIHISLSLSLPLSFSPPPPLSTPRTPTVAKYLPLV